MTNNRFLTSPAVQLEQANDSPIYGYEGLPLLTLEEALEKVIESVESEVTLAKKRCNSHSELLTCDESAAIYLYSMSTPFHSHLNTALRTENQKTLEPWLSFLKLFITALGKLPAVSATVWRGVDFDDKLSFVSDDVQIWWSVTSCSRDLDVVERYLGENPTLYAITVIDGRDISTFSANPDEHEIILMPGTMIRRVCTPLSWRNQLSCVHLEQTKPSRESNPLFERIKRQYKQNSRIERILNPAKSFPIQRSYINLALVTTKEHDEKEQLLRHAQHNAAIMSTFEEIYGLKTTIDVENIFKTCSVERKQVLVFGRAGIGKSTFCRYAAYKWAIGAFWEEYELLALIPLRCLTTDRYPELSLGQSYSLVDLVSKELLSKNRLEENDNLLTATFNVNKTLWILDGYDEVVQNIPKHLEGLLEQLLETPHHIVTSRPYQNTLSYNVKMEITGFTDENIEEYVEQFFDQMKEDLDNTSIKTRTLLKYLQSNRSIWGIAHVPVNLELICSIFSNEDSLETKGLTITLLYNAITEWLCRRCLMRTKMRQPPLSKDEIDQHFQEKLAFLENLAFHAMKSNTIIIRPSLLKRAVTEVKVDFQVCRDALNLGVLKSFNQKGIGTQIETDKDHYFIHLSFQEYFAARYIMHALRRSSSEQAVEFIKYQKYNQRYTLVFTFMAGLLATDDFELCFSTFWDAIMSEPMDLVGIRQIQLMIVCLEAISTKNDASVYDDMLTCITECIRHNFYHQNKSITKHLSQSLQRAPLLACNDRIINMLIDQMQNAELRIKSEILLFISELKMSNPSSELIQSIIKTMQDTNADVRIRACLAAGSIVGKAGNTEVISKLMVALEDEVAHVRTAASYALGMISQKPAPHDVSNNLVHALEDENESVRASASYTLEELNVKTVTDETISKLLTALGHGNKFVRTRVRYFFGNIAKEIATKDVTGKLINALRDDNENVKVGAAYILGKMGEKAATDDVINALLSTLGDENEYARSNACEALGNIGKKAARDEVIRKLESALGDRSRFVRRSACEALANMEEKVKTNEMIRKLITALDSKEVDDRRNACEALGYITGKSAVDDVIRKLIEALEDESELVRISACKALGIACAQEATLEIVSRLANALEDTNERVRVSACESLEMVCKKASTDEVIKKLVNALGDVSRTVRAGVLYLLGMMGEKAARQEVIDEVVHALNDRDGTVRSSACYALADFGRIGMTNEVIHALIQAQKDIDADVRAGAYKALGKICEIEATDEVISTLVDSLKDEDGHVRYHACEALGIIRGKRATNKIISDLIGIINKDHYVISKKAAETVSNIITSPLDLIQLDPQLISNLCLSRHESMCFKNLSMEQLIEICFKAKKLEYISVIYMLALLQGSALTVHQNKLMIYSTKEPTEILIPSVELGQQVVEAFIIAAKQLHLDVRMFEKH